MDRWELQKVWAKSAPVGTDPRDAYHPLLLHMIDTAAVASRLWQETPRLVRAAVGREWGLNDGDATQWVAFLAGTHDLGKASPFFQCQWTAGRELLPPALSIPPLSAMSARPRHGEITAWELRRWLTGRGVSRRAADALARSVGSHHGSLLSNEVMERTSDLAGRGGEPWRLVRYAHADLLADLLDLPSGTPVGPVTPASVMVLAGLTSVADWVASDERLFAHRGPTDDPRAYHRGAERLASEAVEHLGFARPIPPPQATFSQVFGPSPRALQRLVEDRAAEMGGPLLAIIEAPTGVGKTEAALFLQESVARATGEAGMYVALPTMATANQMFSRLHAYLEKRQSGSYLQLLHSRAALSDEFQALLSASRPEPTGLGEPDAKQDSLAGVVAGEWFLRGKRALLTSHGVGTVDHALLAGLHARHFFVRLFGLAGKTVLFDEVHAYDAYMLGIFERLLAWLGALQCTVIVLSATLPADVRGRLVRAYTGGMGRVEDRAPYPRVTWAVRSSPAVHTLAVPVEAHRTIRLSWSEFEGSTPMAGLAERLRQAVGGGGCAAVVCNTVGEAQDLYRQLRDDFPVFDSVDGEPELDLLHARFPDAERRVREARAVRRFGRHPKDPAEPSPHRPRRAVLVATQVIEQSLDLDFDFMITSLAPVDLLLQRVGRLQRFPLPASSRPPGMATPEIVVRTMRNSEGGDFALPPAWGSVYAPHVLLRTWLALRGRSEIIVPDDTEALVEAVYGGGDVPADLPIGLLQMWRDTEEDLVRRRQRLGGEAARRAIPAPDDLFDLFASGQDELEEDNPTVHPALQALTRLGDPSLDVVLIPSDAEAGLETGQPDAATELWLLARSVRLTHRAVVSHLLDWPTPVGWHRSGLLRHARALRLDAQGQCSVGDWVVRLDAALGVVVARGSEGEVR